MSEIDLTKFILLFPTIAAGLLGWFLNRWVQSNDKKNEKVVGHETELATIKISLEQIRDTVNRIESSVERLENKREIEREEFFRIKSQVDAAWRAIDKIHASRSV